MMRFSTDCNSPRSRRSPCPSISVFSSAIVCASRSAAVFASCARFASRSFGSCSTLVLSCALREVSARCSDSRFSLLPLRKMTSWLASPIFFWRLDERNLRSFSIFSCSLLLLRTSSSSLSRLSICSSRAAALTESSPPGLCFRAPSISARSLSMPGRSSSTSWLLTREASSYSLDASSLDLSRVWYSPSSSSRFCSSRLRSSSHFETSSSFSTAFLASTSAARSSEICALTLSVSSSDEDGIFSTMSPTSLSKSSLVNSLVNPRLHSAQHPSRFANF
mmetsp:Transcript_54478/g.129396  ORF Transcript_54478/g.129396 Transcript_54478/m.129396 type:complete len:278 (+) Transcript_54478:1096-1929(+)